MEDILTNFHFVRPLWFWAVIPAVLLYLLLRHRASNASNWEDSIDPGLLPFLLENAGERKAHWIINGLLAAWLITIVSLAGPVWSKIPHR